MLSCNLVSAGYALTVSGSGDEGLRMALASPPSLVILDLELGRMSGVKVCRALKAAPATRHVPVLVVSAHADAQDQRLVVQAGADGFVAKPCGVAELIDRVGQMMAAAATPLSPSH